MSKLAACLSWFCLVQLCGFATAAPTFTGRGLNVHGELLPVADLKAIGIEWVRGEFEGDHFSKDYVQKWRAHYKDFKQLVILLQWKQGPAEAKSLASWGVTEMEVGNEPELSQWTGEAWTPEKYSNWFKSVDAAVGSKTRLYGPANGKWSPDYVSACIRLGCDFDGGITFHGYWDTVENLEGRFWEGKARWNQKEILCTEVGFDPVWIATFKGQYPKVKAPADSFLEMKSKLGKFATCYYDGPNGLFQWDGKGWNKRTPTYEAIRRGLR